MTGSIMYAMLGTRPDLAYVVSTLSRFNSRPIATHHVAAKRCLRYLQSTKDFGILLGGTGLPHLLGYTDSDWGNDKDTRRSVGGYVFMLYGGAISWKSKRQTVVALSSTKAEYVGCTEAAKEAI